jgi:hypothetical protein
MRAEEKSGITPAVSIGANALVVKWNYRKGVSWRQAGNRFKSNASENTNEEWQDGAILPF